MFNKLSFVLALAPLAACASQVDSDHQGDTLAKISGQVRNTRTEPIASNAAEVAVLWVNSSGSPDISVAETVQVTGTFPAQFSLSIYTPPDPTFLNDWYGVKVGVAYIVAGEPNTNYISDDGEGVLGMDEDHLLVYVPQAVPPGSAAATLLRGTPAAGFHVYAVHKLTDAEKASRSACIDGLDPQPTLDEVYSQCGGSDVFDDFVPVSTDLQTPLQIELVNDPSEIDVPNWT